MKRILLILGRARDVLPAPGRVVLVHRRTPSLRFPADRSFLPRLLLGGGRGTDGLAAKHAWPDRLEEEVEKASEIIWRTLDLHVSTPIQWLICVVAALGFAFDIYELLMLPLIVGPALLELLGAKPGTPEFNLWVGLALLAAGRGGRRLRPARRLPDRPASAAGACSCGASCSTRSPRSPPGFATSVELLLFFRCTTFVGVCVEFVAAVAWLAELFPDPSGASRCWAIPRPSPRSAA